MRTFNAIIEWDEQLGGYVGRCAELWESMGLGETWDECLDELRTSVQLILQERQRTSATKENITTEPVILITERERLADEIHAAFRNVSREGGVSWAESRVLDSCNRSNEARVAARASDIEQNWLDLMDDLRWNPEALVGGWSFLDAIGFRYYLPAAMIRCLQSRCDEGIPFHLTLPSGGLRDYRMKQWSQLDERQCHCVARFLRCMVLIDEDDHKDWQAALLSYWQRFLE